MLEMFSCRLVRQLRGGGGCSLEKGDRELLESLLEAVLVDPRLLKRYIRHLVLHLAGESPEYEWPSDEEYEAIVHEGLKPLTDAQFAGLMVDPEGLLVVAQHLVEREDIGARWFRLAGQIPRKPFKLKQGIRSRDNKKKRTEHVSVGARRKMHVPPKGKPDGGGPRADGLGGDGKR